MKRELFVFALIISASFGFGTDLFAAAPTSGQGLRVVPGAPGAAFDVMVDLTTTGLGNNVVSVATRLVFDKTKIGVTAVTRGSAVPAAWGVQYQNSDANTTGKLDLILYDIFGTILDATSGGPYEVIKVTFAYVGTPCTTGSICFNAVAHPDPAIFPVNQYVHYNPGSGGTPVLLASSATGCATVEGHAFIRGDVNMSGGVTAQDVIDLAGSLWGGLTPPDCLAARDVNNSGGVVPVDITDVVTLIQGLFNAGVVTIPAPYPASGVGPTVLPCNVGYVCS